MYALVEIYRSSALAHLKVGLEHRYGAKVDNREALFEFRSAIQDCLCALTITQNVSDAAPIVLELRQLMIFALIEGSKTLDLAGKQLAALTYLAKADSLLTELEKSPRKSILQLYLRASIAESQESFREAAMLFTQCAESLAEGEGYFDLYGYSMSAQNLQDLAANAVAKIETSSEVNGVEVQRFPEISRAATTADESEEEGELSPENAQSERSFQFLDIAIPEKRRVNEDLEVEVVSALGDSKVDPRLYYFATPAGLDIYRRETVRGDGNCALSAVNLTRLEFCRVALRNLSSEGMRKAWGAMLRDDITQDRSLRHGTVRGDEARRMKLEEEYGSVRRGLRARIEGAQFEQRGELDELLVCAFISNMSGYGRLLALKVEARTCQKKIEDACESERALRPYIEKFVSDDRILHGRRNLTPDVLVQTCACMGIRVVVLQPTGLGKQLTVASAEDGYEQFSSETRLAIFLPNERHFDRLVALPSYRELKGVIRSCDSGQEFPASIRERGVECYGSCELVSNTCYQSFLEQNTTNRAVLADLLKALRQLQDFNAAIDVCDRLIELEPGLLQLQRQKAELLFEFGQLRPAYSLVGSLIRRFANLGDSEDKEEGRKTSSHKDLASLYFLRAKLLRCCDPPDHMRILKALDRFEQYEGEYSAEFYIMRAEAYWAWHEKPELTLKYLAEAEKLGVNYLQAQQITEMKEKVVMLLEERLGYRLAGMVSRGVIARRLQTIVLVKKYFPEKIKVRDRRLEVDLLLKMDDVVGAERSHAELGEREPNVCEKIWFWDLKIQICEKTGDSMDEAFAHKVALEEKQAVRKRLPSRSLHFPRPRRVQKSVANVDDRLGLLRKQTNHALNEAQFDDFDYYMDKIHDILVVECGRKYKREYLQWLRQAEEMASLKHPQKAKSCSVM